MKTNILSIIDTILTFALFGGIGACAYYKNSPELVILSSAIALGALLLHKGFDWTRRSKETKLSYAESVEISFLRQIRMLLKNGNEVSQEHISISERASEDSDTAYAELHGFGRPLPAVAAHNTRKLNQG